MMFCRLRPGESNCLKSTTLSGTTTSYLYDGKRLRASTGAAANQNTIYLWDVTAPTVPRLALERDGGGILLRRYQHGADLISVPRHGVDRLSDLLG